MNKNTLKLLRLTTPAIIILLFWSLLGNITQMWHTPIPEDIEQWKQSAPALILSILYYITGLRNLSNGYWFKKVTENLRSKLVEISGLEDNKGDFSWRSIRGIFYFLIDNDISLVKKAELAYFNGFIWTTVADTRAISGLFTLLSLFLYRGGSPDASWAALVFFIIFILSFPASWRVTKWHQSIGNEQIEIIQHSYLIDLIEKLQNVKDRPSKRVD